MSARRLAVTIALLAAGIPAVAGAFPGPFPLADPLPFFAAPFA